MGLFFIRATSLGDPLIEPGDPDAEGWRWVDVWFTRAGAEEIARRHEVRTVIAMTEATEMKARDVSEELVTVAEVRTAREIVEAGGCEALGRALVAVEMTLGSRLAQFEAGVRLGQSNGAEGGAQGADNDTKR